MLLRLSPSQLSTFFGCPASYYQRYILRRRIPPGIALAVGSGIDEAANVNFRQKIATRKDLPLEDFTDAAVTAFDHRLHTDGLLLSKEHASRAEAFIGETKDKLVQMAVAMCKIVAPMIQPLAVQSSVEFPSPTVPEVVYHGKIDILADTHDIIDIKTSKGKWPAGKENSEIQPTVYLPGARHSLGTKSEKFVYHIVTKGKTSAHHIVKTTRDESDITSLDEKSKIVVAMRKAGLFPPCDPGHWRCGPDWCAFYLAGCKYVSDRNRKHYLI